MRPCTVVRLLLVATLVVTSHHVSAQTPAGLRPAVAGIGEIRGTVIDSVNGRVVTTGSITVRRASDSSFAGGSLPKADGTFRVDGLLAGRYTLRVRALGYGPVVLGDLVISAAQPIVDVGTVRLSTVATVLKGQEVVAEREETVIAPDRISYSTKNMTAASGGTAVDVLRNIPQVEVDGSNKVSLRNNENVVIQINGRSTPLRGQQLGMFLAQLPAGTVRTVEVATNPSAKSDPEGTAGIINVVLDQEAELGLSGGVFAGTSSSGQLDIGGNVGKQHGPFSLLLSANLYADHRGTTGAISRENLLIPVPVYVETRISGTNRPLSGGGTVRSEYRFNERDVLSLDGFFYGGHNTVRDTSYYTDLDRSRSVVGLFNQFNETVLGNFSQDYAIQFRRQGARTAPQFTAEIEYSNTYNRNDVTLTGDLIQADATTPAAIPQELDHTVGHLPTWNLKADYTKPFGVRTKLEAGVNGTQRATANDFVASYLDDASGSFVPSVTQSTAFDYKEDIGAAYAVLSQQIAKVQAQAGLRLEDVSTHLELPTSALSLDTRYASAFPSAILAYALTDSRRVRLSYSRRVSRPSPQQLSPAEYRQDTRNVFHGNPGLRPEYTDAAELLFLDAHSWGTVLVNPYLRHTAHALRNIQFVDSSGVSVRTYDNVASTRTVGSDFNVSVRHGPLMASGGGSVFHYSSDASNLSDTFSVHTVVWSLRGSATWKFSPLVDAQAFANFRPSFKTEGGSTNSQTLMNASARYKAWGDDGSVTLRVSDPFRLQRFGYRTINGTVIEDNDRYFHARAIYITISRTFGKALKLRDKEPETVQAPPNVP
jgi:hypothetical protein